ncbi:VCBS domain-containing protein, partial [Mesorhizobium sp. B2-8-3]|uniref:VCBS domain-containing protein n=1 Tax=Mesorhizobium sp. B2-8-3 TaxID=2589905 RepID=UPI00116B6D12
AAVIGTPTVADVTEDSASPTLTASGAISISDADQNQSSFQTTVSGDAGNLGSLTLAANGSYTYSVANAAVQYLGENDTKIDTFTVTALDGTTKQVSFTVHGVNDAAVITGNSSGSVTEDAVLTVNGALTVNDPDAGQNSFLVHTSINPIAGTYGSLTIDASGNWVYTLNNAAANVQALTSADHPHDQIHVLSADGTDHVIDITVNGANEPVTNHAPSAPVFVPGSAPIADGNPIDLGHFLSVDPDAGDSVSFTGTWSGTGTVAVAANGELTASVGLGSSATGTLTVTATDNHSASSAPQSFTVWIGNANGSSVDNTITLVSTDPTIADGRAGTDSVTGTSAVDYIFGGAGNDTIIGKANADWLVGGDGADHFVYTAVADSTHAAFDTIQDFLHGTDKLDFLDTLNLTGTPTNLGASTTLAAHSVGWTTDGTNTIVYANVGTSAEAITNGADVIEIHLLGVTNLSSADINLHA